MSAKDLRVREKTLQNTSTTSNPRYRGSRVNVTHLITSLHAALERFQFTSPMSFFCLWCQQPGGAKLQYHFDRSSTRPAVCRLHLDDLSQRETAAYINVIVYKRRLALVVAASIISTHYLRLLFTHNQPGNHSSCETRHHGEPHVHVRQIRIHAASTATN